MALQLGISNVWDWLRKLPWHQFLEWIEFEKVNGPWGSEREETVNALGLESLINEMKLLNYQVSRYMAKNPSSVNKPEFLQSGDLLPYREDKQTEYKSKKKRKPKKDNSISKQRAEYYLVWLANHEARKKLI